MPARIYSDPKAFAQLEAAVKPCEASGRTASAAFLIWFLQTIYRMDEVAAQDAVCDKRFDMGIDALATSDSDQEIVLFQAKRKEKLPGTLGDTDLKEFVGVLTHFTSEESVSHLASSTQNPELKQLLVLHKVAERLKNGYKVRLIFISNVAANSDATGYLKCAASAGVNIDLWDLSRLAPVLRQLAAEWFVEEPVRLRLVQGKMFVDGPKTAPNLVFAAVPANELVRIPGIEDTRVFAQNVRLGLGQTRVNNEIFASVMDKREHASFLTFHNGLTIVSKDLHLRGSSLKINRFSVCNGCQSLLTFHKHRNALTKELEVLVRFVRVGDDRDLAESIAYRTNNQNPISLRDLSANDPTQLQLKAEFDGLFGYDATYGIKRGAVAQTTELPNEVAGQMLLALYVRQPWSAHQKYRIFDDLQRQIFRYGITASQIRLAQLIARAAGQAVCALGNERVRKYGLTRFLVLYLAGEVLRKEFDGLRLLDDPKPYLQTESGAGKAAQQQVLASITEIVKDVVTELDYYVKSHGGDAYDYKSEFKSVNAVAAIANEVLKGYEKDKHRGRVTAFTLPQ